MSTKVKIDVVVPQVPTNSRTYPVMLAWNGNINDAVMFISEDVGVRIGATRVGDLGHKYTNCRATNPSWQELPKGTTVTFTQE